MSSVAPIEKSESQSRFVRNTETIVSFVKTSGAPVRRWSGQPEDPTRSQWMRLTELSAGFDFWNHPGEDIYSKDDGEQL